MDPEIQDFAGREAGPEQLSCAPARGVMRATVSSTSFRVSAAAAGADPAVTYRVNRAVRPVALLDAIGKRAYAPSR